MAIVSTMRIRALTGIARQELELIIVIGWDTSSTVDTLVAIQAGDNIHGVFAEKTFMSERTVARVGYLQSIVVVVAYRTFRTVQTLLPIGTGDVFNVALAALPTRTASANVVT
jgi:hypothetical protein